MWPFRRKSSIQELKPTPAPKRQVRALSLLELDAVRELGGLPPHAVYGFVEGEGPPANDNFRANPAFVTFMHRVIQIAGPGDPELAKLAADQTEDTNVYIIDLRTPDGPQGRVPMEDIIGCFAVRGGKIVEASYWANPAHQLISRHGRFQLPSSLQHVLIHMLKRNVVPADVAELQGNASRSPDDPDLSRSGRISR